MNGEIYESAIFGIFAVAVIVTAKDVVSEAHLYRTLLSGFVKVTSALDPARYLAGNASLPSTCPIRQFCARETECSESD